MIDSRNLIRLLPIVLSGGIQIPSASAEQRVFNFNSDWLVHVGDEVEMAHTAFPDDSWKKVTLPHAWNEENAFKLSIDKLPTGIAWYRKHFSLPEDASGGMVFLEFEGIRQGGEFYLNGEWIGRSENGVMAFGFDISDKVKPGQNVLAVRTDNDWLYKEKSSGSRYQWNDKNFNANYGGLNRNVKLHVTDRLYQTLPLWADLETTGVYVYASDFDIAGGSATITAESQVKNEHAEPKTFAYEVTITDPDGKVVATMSGGSSTLAAGETTTVKASSKLSGLHFWSWGYGYLYDVETVLSVDGKPVDAVTTRTGFRRLEFGNGVVKLNDRVLHLKGYAQRTTNEWPAVGVSVPPWMSDFSNGLMVESGANLVRWMHTTPSRQDVDSCDRVGLLQAMPAGDAEKDPVGGWWRQRLALMREAIVYNRNNPSIVFYEAGNNQISEEHMAEMKAIRDELDPYGGRAIGSRNMLDSEIAEFGGEMLYINKSAGKPMWMMEYSRDEGLRKYWDEFTPPYHKDGDGPPHRGKPAAEYNRNQDSHAIENIVRWFEYWRERPGTGMRVNAGGVNIVFSDTNTHYRGEENYRRSGEVDPMRIPKDGFYTHQVMWDGWVDPKPGIHIIGHWNYEAGVKKPIYVVSSADEVELYVNGRSLGKGKQSYRFLYSWENVEWQSGEIEAVGRGSNGEEICRALIETAGDPAAIKLTPHTGPGGLCADGADLALVDVEVVDAKGNRCPTAMDMVSFKLDGPATWKGGIAQGPDNYILSEELPVECGVNRVMLRSLTEAGKVVLSASSPGLQPARIELASQPFESKDGLSLVMPDVGMEGTFRRGPTPQEDTVTPTRRNIRIVGANAGANSGQTGKAYDDNEETNWENDGKRETGWIEFELEREATPTELTMKMGGWRNKAYPIRVTVDGVEVFKGATPKSLGYVTLPLKPAKGRSLKIELVGAIDAKDAFNLIEVTGQKLPDVTKVKSDVLQIVEAEVYEALEAKGR